MKNGLFISVILLATFFVVLIWAMGVVGDSYCTIYIRNAGKEPLILKTYQLLEYDMQMVVDSITLDPDQSLEIGHCINCATPDTTGIHFDAIAFFNKEERSRVNSRAELIKYLESYPKDDCITYSVK